MTDEAREAARLQTAMLLASMAMRNPGSVEDFRAVFDAGVVEGIRQAREAVGWIILAADLESNEAQQAWMADELRRRLAALTT